MTLVVFYEAAIVCEATKYFQKQNKNKTKQEKDKHNNSNHTHANETTGALLKQIELSFRSL